MRSITAGLSLSLIGGVALAQTPPAPAQPPKPPAAQPAPGSSAQGDDAPDADAMRARPHPRDGMAPRPDGGGGARFRIRTPAMTVGVKCPDDESMKACVDAISGLLDKVAVQPHP